MISRLNYLNENIYYYTGNVYEYDIKHAYPSILKGTQFLFKDKKLRHDIETLNEYVDKRSLLIRIGMEIRDNSNIMEYINDYLLKSIEQFQIDNNLNENNIISIKKDAIFTTSDCKQLKFGKVEFVKKHTYSLYLYDYINKFEYYIFKRGSEYKYAVKGLGEDYDRHLYGCIVHFIYLTLSNNDLNKLKQIQKMFLSNNPKCLQYCPNEVIYRDYLYLDRSKITEEMAKDVDYKDVYFTYYASIFKVLINYLL